METAATAPPNLVLFPHLLLLPKPSPPPPPTRRFLAFSSSRLDSNTGATGATTDSEDLRAQLNQLRLEADTTRAKVNSARMRLMRLSEAAERFQRQAAVKVRVGLEMEARDMLLQKRKVMQVLEKCKSHIEVLDKLSAKLSEAISVKETQLIGSITADVEADVDDPSPIRIVTPKDEMFDNIPEIEDCDPEAEAIISVEDEGHDSREDNIFEKDETKNGRRPEGSKSWDYVAMAESMEGVSSFQEFVEHLDKQLSKIEEEIITVLRYPELVLEKDQKLNNFKLQETCKLLGDVKGIRERIASIKEAQM